MDTSTLDLDVLRSLPVATYRHSDLVSRTEGCGCAGDPPGFPSYLLRSVTVVRRSASAPAYVIVHEGEHYVVATEGDSYEGRVATLRRLWKPLPLDHARTEAWIRDTYRHHARMYRDDAGAVTSPRDGGCFVWPVSACRLRTFRDDPRFSDAWRDAERAAVAAHNADVRARAAAIAVPENHSAHRIVSRYYPEATPRLDLIANPPTEIALWWETDAARPAPEACRPRSMGPHPINGSWCQWCGWRVAEVG
jgi:hypothetical protein